MAKKCCNCHFIGKTNRSATLWKFRKSDGEIIWTRALQPELDPTGTFVPDITHGNSCYLDGDGIVSVGGDGSASEDRLVVQRWDSLIAPTKQWQREFTSFDGFSDCYCRVHGGYVWIVNTDGKVLTLNAADGTTVTQSTISAPQYYYFNGRIWIEPGSTDGTIQIGPFVEYNTSWSATQSLSETVSSAYLSGSTYAIIYSNGGTPTVATVNKSDLSTVTDVYTLSDINSIIVAFDGSTIAIYQPGTTTSIGVSTGGSLLWTQLFRVGTNDLSTSTPGNGTSQTYGGSILFNGDKFSLSTGADLNGGGWTGLGGRRQQTDGTYTFFAAGDVRAYNVSDGTQAWTYSHPGGNAFYDMWAQGNYLYAASYAVTVSSA